MGVVTNVELGTCTILDLGKFYLTHNKIGLPANGAWLGPGAEFLNFGTVHLHIFGSGKARHF